MMQDWEEGDGDYLAPELLQEASPTPAADIYSLGATLYECATGVGRATSDTVGRELLDFVVDTAHFVSHGASPCMSEPHGLQEIRSA